MKVSLNWVKQIIERDQASADPTKIGIDALVEKIGAQLGAVEAVIDVGKKYQGIVIAKVVSCAKHPNADKLSVCLIDDGKKVKKVKRNRQGLVEVVCRAPNVAADQLVAWLPPGATVPSTIDKEPLALEAREIRGVVSNGMIASTKELDLADDHTGILVIEDAKIKDLRSKIKPGDNFAKAFGLDDYVIDIENKMFTHRPDLFGQLGIARELAGIQGMVFRSPKWYLVDKTTGRHKTDDRLLKVKNETPELVPRFMMRVVKNVEIKSSSPRILASLASVGIRPINNVVDVTNYVMLETAQPLHAYDYDKVKALCGGLATIIVRRALPGEKLKLLGGEEITLTGDEIAIATDKTIIGLGGVMGGADTEVDASTQNIILEAGTFDMNTTRRVAMTHGFFSEAATRFTKGQSPWQNDRAMALAHDYLIHEAGGLPARSIYDLKTKLPKPPSVDTSATFINERLGLKLSLQQMKKLLENVEFEVKVSNASLNVKAPFWRTDIEIAEDIVEEVGRLYGYDHLPLDLPMRNLSPTAHNPMIDLKNNIRQKLLAAGANEVLTYSFVHGSLLQKVGQDHRLAYQIKNALSPDLQYYRLSLAPSLLEKIHPNIKLGFEEFALFEIGLVHAKDKLGLDKLPQPLERLGLVYASKTPKPGAAYFEAKKYCDFLLSSLGVKNFGYRSVKGRSQDRTGTYYEFSRSADIFVDDQLIGRVGEYKSEVRADLKLPPYCAGFELRLDTIAKAQSWADYQPLNRFPALNQDISLRVPADTTYSETYDLLKTVVAEAEAKSDYRILIEPLDIFQKPNDKKHKQITLRIVTEHPDRTLTTTEINQLLEAVAAKAKTKLKAERL